MNVYELVVRDCGYGFSAYAVLPDGAHAFHTTRLHPSQRDAEAEVSARAGGISSCDACCGKSEWIAEDDEAFCDACDGAGFVEVRHG